MTVTVLSEEHGVVWVRGALSGGECREVIEGAEGVGFVEAPITTAFGFVHAPEVRNNLRVIRDDWDLAARLWPRVQPHVPGELRGWRAVGLNERFRLYRYTPGQYFRWHCDGAFVRNERELSLLTVLFYLNGDVLGGATQLDGIGDVAPEEGAALIFQHRVRHQGEEVLDGVKYVLRTDVMYAAP